MLFLCASAASASISIMFEFGFPSVSMKIAFVLGFIAFSNSSMLSGSTKVVSIPNSVKVCAR